MTYYEFNPSLRNLSVDIAAHTERHLPVADAKREIPNTHCIFQVAQLKLIYEFQHLTARRVVLSPYKVTQTTVAVYNVTLHVTSCVIGLSTS